MMKWRHMQTKSSKAASENKSPSKEKCVGGFARSVSLPDLSRSSYASRRFVEAAYDADGDVCATGRALYNMKVKDINVNQILTRLIKFTGDQHESEDLPERTYVDESLGAQVNISRLKPDCESEGGTVSKTANQHATSATCQLVPTDNSSVFDGLFIQSQSSGLKLDGGWRVVSTPSKPGDGTLRRQIDDKRSASQGVTAGLNVSDNARTPSRSRKLPSISEDSEDTAHGETISNDDSGIEETGNGEDNEQSGHGRDSQSSPEDDDVWTTKEDGLVARFVSTLSDRELESAVLQKPAPRTDNKSSLSRHMENTPESCAASRGSPDLSLRPTTLFLRDDHEIYVTEYPTGSTAEKSEVLVKEQPPDLPSHVRETIPIDQEVNFDVRHCVRRVRVGHAKSKMPKNPQALQVRRKSDPRLPLPDEILPTLPPAHYHGLQADNPPQPAGSASRTNPPLQNQMELCIKLNVAHYAPEEILVVLEGGSLVVSGERFSFSEYGCESCHFYRQYPLPEGFTKFDVSSTITESGILVITGMKGKERESGTADRKTFERKPVANEFQEVLGSGARLRRNVSVDSADFQDLDGQRYVLLVDCYGCPASDVSVKLQGRSLLIQTKSTLMHWEDRHGRHKSTTRKYALPANSALESVTARMMDGDVLKVEVLKLPGNGSQQYEG